MTKQQMLMAWLLTMVGSLSACNETRAPGPARPAAVARAAGAVPASIPLLACERFLAPELFVECFQHGEPVALAVGGSHALPDGFAVELLEVDEDFRGIGPVARLRLTKGEYFEEFPIFRDRPSVDLYLGQRDYVLRWGVNVEDPKPDERPFGSQVTTTEFFYQVALLATVAHLTTDVAGLNKTIADRPPRVEEKGQLAPLFSGLRVLGASSTADGRVTRLPTTVAKPERFALASAALAFAARHYATAVTAAGTALPSSDPGLEIEAERLMARGALSLDAEVGALDVTASCINRVGKSPRDAEGGISQERRALGKDCALSGAAAVMKALDRLHPRHLDIGAGAIRLFVALEPGSPQVPSLTADLARVEEQMARRMGEMKTRPALPSDPAPPPSTP